MPAFPSFQKTSADDPYSGSPTAMKYATGPWWNTTFEAQDKFTPSTGSGMLSWASQNQGAQATNQNVQALNAATNQVAQGGSGSEPGAAAAPADTTPDWSAIQSAIESSKIANPYGTSWYPQQLTSTLESLKSWYGGLDPTKQTAARPALLSTAQSIAPAALYFTPESYLNKLKGYVGSSIRTPEEVAADNARWTEQIDANRKAMAEQAKRVAESLANLNTMTPEEVSSSGWDRNDPAWSQYWMSKIAPGYDYYNPDTWPIWMSGTPLNSMSLISPHALSDEQLLKAYNQVQTGTMDQSIAASIINPQLANYYDSQSRKTGMSG